MKEANQGAEDRAVTQVELELFQGTADGPPAVDEAALEAIRAELSAVRGPAFWAKLEELSGTSAFQGFLKRSFPSQAQRFIPDLERRDFLRLMSSSLAVAGLGACTRQPEETLAPYAKEPESTVPGKPRYFATSMPVPGDALGILVESHMNRPTKVEGNPDHPSSRGATDGMAQAAVLSLYDPDRSHSPLRAGQISTWSAFAVELEDRLKTHEAGNGRGLAVLVGDERSPTLAHQLRGLRERFPELMLAHWTPLHRDTSRAGTQLAFGQELQAVYRMDRARVIVSLDADFLGNEPGHVRYARDFAAGRRGREASASINRLYAIESSASLTGAMADGRIAVRPSEVEGAARALLAQFQDEVSVPALAPALEARVQEIAADLRQAGSRGLVVPGEWQSPKVHAIAHALNARSRKRGRFRCLRGLRAGLLDSRPRRGDQHGLDPPGGGSDPRGDDLDARHVGRQSGLRRAGRPRLRGSAQEGAFAGSSVPIRR